MMSSVVATLVNEIESLFNVEVCYEKIISKSVPRNQRMGSL